MRNTRNWKLVAYVVVLFLFLSMVAADCPPEWSQLGDICYRTFNSTLGHLNYFDSSRLCYGAGGRLVEPKTAEKNAFLMTLWPDVSDDISLGLRFTDDWRWSDGVAAVYRNWDYAAGEPNNYKGQERCVEIKQNLKWNDIDCNSQNALHAFCETVADSVEWTVTVVTSSSNSYSDTTSDISYRLVGSNGTSRTFVPPNERDDLYTLGSRETFIFRTFDLGELKSIDVEVLPPVNAFRLQKITVKYNATVLSNECNCWMSNLGSTSKRVDLWPFQSYEIRVKTSNETNAGTVADIRVKLSGSDATSTWQVMGIDGQMNILQDAIDVFDVGINTVGVVNSIEIHMMSPLDDWKLEHVTVKDPKTNKEYRNLCDCWIGQSLSSKVIPLAATVRYSVGVITSDIVNAGTTAAVYIKLRHGNGQTTSRHTLHLPGSGFPRATTNHFVIDAVDVGSIVTAKIALSDPLLPWHIRLITVKDTKTGVQYVLNCNCWIPPSVNEGHVIVPAVVYHGRLPLICDSTAPDHVTAGTKAWDIFRQYARSSPSLKSRIFWGWIEQGEDKLLHPPSKPDTIFNFTDPQEWMVKSGIVAPEGRCGAVRPSDVNKTLYLIECDVNHATHICSFDLVTINLMAMPINCFPTWKSVVTSVNSDTLTCEAECVADVSCLGVSVRIGSRACLLYQTSQGDILRAIHLGTNICSCDPSPSWTTRMKLIVGYNVAGTYHELDFCEVSTVMSKSSGVVVSSSTSGPVVATSAATQTSLATPAIHVTLTTDAMQHFTATSGVTQPSASSSGETDISPSPVAFSSNFVEMTASTKISTSNPPKTTTTRNNPTTTQSSPPKSPGSTYCSCSCINYNPPSNHTVEQKRAFIHKLLSNITVITRANSTRFKLSKISVNDNRTSATNIGILGGTLLTVAIGGLIFSDVPVMLLHLSTAIDNIKSLFVK